MMPHFAHHASLEPPPRPGPRPDKGSLRVQGWLYTAINPMLESCERDLRLLELHRLTWQHGSGELRSLRGAREHLHAAGRINLGDLLRFVPDLEPLLEAHEAQIEAVASAAAEAHALLCAHPELRRAVASARRRVAGAREVGAETLIARVAEHLLNAEDDVVDGPERELWRLLRPRLSHLAGGEPMAGLRVARSGLTRATEHLGRALAEVRTRLCDEFDLPPAPVPLPVMPERR